MKKLIILVVGVTALYLTCNAQSDSKVIEVEPDYWDKDLEIKEVPEIIEEIKEVEAKTNTLNHFIHAVGFKESTNNYTVVNKYGYKGRYQFGRMALKDLNLHKMSTKDFLSNRKLQDTAFISLLSINKHRLRKCGKYIGKTINGIQVTESGMLAASHLVGAGNVKRWLKTSGKYSKPDANGTSVDDYMSLFSGYDMKPIVAKRTINLR